MTREYFVFYTEASIFCIFIFALLLHYDLTTSTRSERQVQYDHMLVAFMLYFVSDAFWAGVISGFIPHTRLTVALPNLANFVVISLVSYQWMRFAAVSEGMPRRNDRWVKVLMRLPMEVMSIFMLLAWIIAPNYWHTTEGVVNPLYFYLLIVAPGIYLASSFVYSMIRAAGQKDGATRGRFMLIGLFPMMVMVIGVMQLFVLDAPLFCIGCTLLMLFFFLQEVQDQISIDTLTGLNNRGQLQRYVKQEVGRRDGAQLYVMMIDANDFKSINDTYGHAEGDRALILIAETLKHATMGLTPSPFLGRYGGDEFVLVIHTEDENVVMGMIVEIQRNLRERSQAHALPYPLAVSIGYAAMLQGRDSFNWCLKQADERLYREKARAKVGR